MKTRIVAIAGMALAVTGCATVIAGTTQDIRIVSDPPGAECRVTRDDVVTTPATVNVPRSRSFASTDERDRYFAEMRLRVSTTADAEVKRVMDGCPQSKREFCTIEADRVKAARQSALDSIEQKKTSARIGK